MATSSKVLAERRDDLVSFVAAEMDAYKYAATHRDETVKLAHEMTHAKPDDKRAEFIIDQAIAKSRSIRRWRFPPTASTGCKSCSSRPASFRNRADGVAHRHQRA